MKKLIFLFLFVTSLSMAQVPSLWRVVHGDTLYPAPGLILKTNYLTFDPTFYNTFIGQGAGNFITTGPRNTGIGYQSLYSNTTGYQNTANGVNAGRTLITGNSNTFFGYGAGYNASQKTDAVNSMALGNGAYNTLDNQVVIGNTSVTQTLLNGNVGIGTTSPGQLLDVNGNINSAGNVTISGTIKIAGGTPGAGKILTSDPNGLASWATNSGQVNKGQVNGTT